MCFEHGWISLFQMLAAKPSGRVDDGTMRGAQSQYPFERSYIYDHQACSTNSDPKPPAT
jgi:cyclopropane-fatty-acyl-phospholipid synthase